MNQVSFSAEARVGLLLSTVGPPLPQQRLLAAPAQKGAPRPCSPRAPLHRGEWSATPKVTQGGSREARVRSPQSWARKMPSASAQGSRGCLASVCLWRGEGLRRDHLTSISAVLGPDGESWRQLDRPSPAHLRQSLGGPWRRSRSRTEMQNGVIDYSWCD